MADKTEQRSKALEWARKCWPIEGELSRRVNRELMQQAFMQGYDRKASDLSERWFTESEVKAMMRSITHCTGSPVASIHINEIRRVFAEEHGITLDPSTTMAKKNDSYLELPCGFDLTVEVLQDFIDRAKELGLTEVDVDVKICPYSGGVDGVKLRAGRTP